MLSPLTVLPTMSADNECPELLFAMKNHTAAFEIF